MSHISPIDCCSKTAMAVDAEWFSLTLGLPVGFGDRRGVTSAFQGIPIGTWSGEWPAYTSPCECRYKIWYPIYLI